MKRILFLIAIFLIGIEACKTVPITGRRALKLISSNEVNTMSFQQYDELLKTSNLSTNRQKVDAVKRVGKRIQEAATKYLTEKGHAKLLEGYEWEFNLIESEQINAFCMPGGKVAFYTGILPVCQDDAGIAVVMGHEVAHAIAEHGNERMSQALVQQLGGVALNVAIAEEPEETKQLFGAAYGLGSQYGVMLPFSRKHESEADELGLIFMALAGYNPQNAPDFWQRMSNLGGQKPPELMSTHPSDETRINNLNKWMPKAMKYYNESNAGN